MDNENYGKVIEVIGSTLVAQFPDQEVVINQFEPEERSRR